MAIDRKNNSKINLEKQEFEIIIKIIIKQDVIFII